MKTITKTTKARYNDKGSKFIGILYRANTVAEFETKLEQIKENYRDASHHCYAWRISPNEEQEFAQDDGEPSGTAGLPILNKLKSAETINIGCVVVRYFGGTKLGKPGLIKAYGYTAALCLQKVELIALVQTQNFTVTYPYSQQPSIDQLKSSFDLKELKAEYLEEVTLKMACRLEQVPAFAKKLQQLEHLAIETEKGEQSYVTLDL